MPKMSPVIKANFTLSLPSVIGCFFSWATFVFPHNTLAFPGNSFGFPQSSFCVTSCYLILLSYLGSAKALWGYAAPLQGKIQILRSNTKILRGNAKVLRWNAKISPPWPLGGPIDYTEDTTLYVAKWVKLFTNVLSTIEYNIERFVYVDTILSKSQSMIRLIESSSFGIFQTFSAAWIWNRKLHYSLLSWLFKGGNGLHDHISLTTYKYMLHSEDCLPCSETTIMISKASHAIIFIFSISMAVLDTGCK